jgi:hypothetical protein
VSRGEDGGLGSSVSLKIETIMIIDATDGAVELPHTAESRPWQPVLACGVTGKFSMGDSGIGMSRAAGANVCDHMPGPKSLLAWPLHGMLRLVKDNQR